MNLPKVLVILGPTASGKSSLGVKLAKRFGGEIISADSRQVYKGLDIGTGKITKKEMSGIPHYLLDVVSPQKTFSVAQYQKLANLAIKKTLQKKKLPIIVGGTGLYIDALIYDLKFPKVKPQKGLRAKLEKFSTEELFKKLKKIDPERAKNIDKNNRRRLIRAIEIVESTGSPISQISKTPKYDCLKIGINLSKEILKTKIKKRLEDRLKSGLVAEVRKLKKQLDGERLDSLGLEYRYVNRYLDGAMTCEEMKAKLLTEIWHYAKRQMTWFSAKGGSPPKADGSREHVSSGKEDSEIYWIKNYREAEKLIKNFLF